MIGIYGGTFDPVHYGHLRTAVEMKEVFALEQLRLIPCHQSPLKNASQASPAQRLAMLQLSIADEPGLVCDDRELVRSGKSYMVDTLASLRQDFPAKPLLLFIGTDALAQLESWYRWQQLFDFAHVVVMMRPNIEKPKMSEFLQNRQILDISQLNFTQAGNLFFQNITQLDISATQIRALQEKRQSIRFLLPDNVINYIEQHNLYQNSRNLNAN